MSMRFVVVVARYQENLDWLWQVPSKYELIVYNKGDDLDSRSLPHRTVIKSLNNVGRETDTYCRYAIEYYDYLHDIVVFCQGDPFDHSPEFIRGLENVTEATSFMPLSIQFVHAHLPPLHIKEDFLKKYDEDFRMEEIDPFTLNTILFHDPGCHHFFSEYRRHFKITTPTNIIADFLSRVHANPQSIEDVRQSKSTYLCWGAIFAVSKNNILQHSRECYRIIRSLSAQYWFFSYVAERSWANMFESPQSSRDRIENYRVRQSEQPSSDAMQELGKDDENDPDSLVHPVSDIK